MTEIVYIAVQIDLNNNNSITVGEMILESRKKDKHKDRFEVKLQEYVNGKKVAHIKTKESYSVRQSRKEVETWRKIPGE